MTAEQCNRCNNEAIGEVDGEALCQGCASKKSFLEVYGDE